MELIYQFHEVNGIKLHVGHAGMEHDKLIFFLHGFPEFSYGWKNQIDFFVENGFHVVVPDQRGYNLSDKPKGVESYQMEFLVMDIVMLIRSLSEKKVYLVGHDWGGGVGWALAQHHPELLEKLIILNMPHPQIMKETLKTNPKQMLRSWYAGFFQLPWLPELICRSFNYKWLVASLLKTSNEGTFSDNEIEAYKKSWREKKSLTSMINWYRAFRKNGLAANQDVTIPTLILWGPKDKFLSKLMAEKSIKRCTNGKLKILEELTHWLHHEDPQKVNGLMLEFIDQDIEDIV